MSVFGGPVLVRRLERLAADAAPLLRRLELFREGPKGRGQLPEVESYRPYTFGDDPRYVDWALYARLERFYVKNMVREEGGGAHLLVDVSASMHRPYSRKLRLAQELAAGLGYLHLVANNYVTVAAWSDGLLQFNGPFWSVADAPRLLQAIESLPRGKGTDLFPAVSDLVRMPAVESGSLVLISDLIDVHGGRSVLATARNRGLEAGALQVLATEERAPQRHFGWVEFRDPETGRRLRRRVGHTLRRRLTHARDEFVDSVRRDFQTHTPWFHCCDPSTRFEAAVLSFLRNGLGSP